jgi:FkbM family methyltransferase
MIDTIKNHIFKVLHGGKGYPKQLRGHQLRFDESLRRFNVDGEEAIQEVIASRVPEGGFFVDIGANFGLHALLACQLAGPRGKVLAVEPVPANLALLRRNLSLNGFANRCTVAAMALTDGSADSVEMTIEPGLSLVASLAENFKGEKVHVPTGTLDNLLAGEDRVPDLIKIDVEGAEHEVLKGAVKTLQKGPPLIIEVHRFALGSFNSSSEQLAEYLRGFGYKEVRIGETQGKFGDYHHSVFLCE